MITGLHSSASDEAEHCAHWRRPTSSSGRKRADNDDVFKLILIYALLQAYNIDKLYNCCWCTVFESHLHFIYLYFIPSRWNIIIIAKKHKSAPGENYIYRYYYRRMSTTNQRLCAAKHVEKRHTFTHYSG